MALRQTLARMGRTVASSGAQTTAFRAFGASAMRGAEEGTSTMAAFMDKFVATAPSTLDKPFTPTDFMPEKKEAPAVTPEKLTLSMYMPHKIEFNASEVRTSSSSRVCDGVFRKLDSLLPRTWAIEHRALRCGVKLSSF